MNLDYFNVGSGNETSIYQLAKTIKNVVNYTGKIELDKSKPDGVMRKFLDTKRIRSLGWKPKVKLFEGLKKTYQNFQNFDY